MRFDTNIPLKSRKRLELANFRGVDLTSSHLRISTSRAAESYNLISENGINRKRPGWESLLALDARINGIFPYVLDGDIQNYQSVFTKGSEVLLVHAGYTLYLVSNDYQRRIVLSAELSNQRSQCFCRNGKAFIVGAGGPWVFGAHDGQNFCLLKNLREAAYVPTTTVDIERLEDGREWDAGRTSYDKVNLLTAWRKNELVLPDTDIEASTASFVVKFKLDGQVNESYPMAFTIEGYENIEITIGNNGNCNFELEGDGYSYNVALTSDQVYEGYDIITFTFPQAVWKIVRGRILTVKFYAKDGVYTGYESITNCRFGSVFGVDGKTDRLFLSGNPAYPNRDWWSEENNFTYFPDENTMEVGSSGSAITGYARLSDSTMGVFKDGAAGGDATIYYRTGKTVTVTDDTEFSYAEDIFPATAGTAGEGLLTPFGVANLSGDVLMLGRDGVYGIELSSNIASVERYQRERSRAIYGDLRQRSFADAAMITHKGRLYMAPHDGSGICYVADARYPASFEGADTGYEWWVWDNIPARVFAVYQDRLLFGDAQGRVCAFREGTFADRISAPLEEGYLSDMDENGVFSYDAQIEPKDGDRIITDNDEYTNAFYVQLIEKAEIDADGKIKIPEDESVYLQIYDGLELWADNADSTGLSAGQAYRVCGFDLGSLTFSLEKNGSTVIPSAGGFRLCIQATEAVVCNADPTKKEFCLKSIGDAGLPVICYNNEPPELNYSWLVEITPVVATWLSGFYNLGTYMDRKTLLGLSVEMANDCGPVSFGFETASGESKWDARGIKGFDFNDIDFGNFTFLSPFAASATKRMNVRNFNFIRFVYRSEGDADCAVSGMTVLYKINQTNRGMF